MAQRFDWKQYSREYVKLDRRTKSRMRTEVRSEKQVFQSGNDAMLQRISILVAVLSIALTVLFGCTCGRTIDGPARTMVLVSESAAGLLILYSIAVVITERNRMKDDHIPWMIRRMTMGKGWTPDKASDMMDIDGIMTLDCLRISSEKLKWHMRFIGWGTLASMIAFFCTEMFLL